MLTHLQAIWCKVITQENTEADEALLRPWTPLVHIITSGLYLNKHQKLRKAIGISISNTNKMLFFVVQMYARNHFTNEEMTEYKMIPTNEKNDWTKTLA